MASYGHEKQQQRGLKVEDEEETDPGDGLRGDGENVRKFESCRTGTA